MIKIYKLNILIAALFVWFSSNSTAISIEWSDISPSVPKIEKKDKKKIPAKKKSHSEFTVVNSYDMTRDAYHNIRDISHKSCKKRCASDRRCVAYTYNIWNQWCFLKSDLGKIFLEPASISGVKKNYSVPDKTYWSIEMARYRKRVFPGHTYKKINGSNFGSCEETCRQEDTCVVFTFSQKSSVCFLKDFAEEYTRSSTMDSGVKRQRQ